MSLVPYVHVDDPLTGVGASARVVLPAETRHHLTRVLRAADGAPLELADGAGWWAPARLEGAHAVLVEAARRLPSPSTTLHVAQSLAKGRKLDEVVRILTELGVDRITPLAAERSVVRLDGDRATKLCDRLQGVARAASAQARRAERPTIGPPVTLADLLADRPADEVVLLAHPGAPALPVVLGSLGLATSAGADDAERSVCLLVGPEGGFSDAEVARARAAGVHPVGLGPSILRTEHAAAVAGAVILAFAGRWEPPAAAPAG